MTRRRPTTALAVVGALGALLAALLTGGTPALAGGATAAADGTDHHPQHTSDDEPGQRARPLRGPSRLSGPTTDSVTWQVSPGVTYTRWDQTDARGPVRAHLLTVDPATPGLLIDYARKGAVRSTAATSEILKVDGAVAGVNGDFYDIDDTDAPLGLGVDRQLGLLHGRRSGWNAAFYLTPTGKPRIGTVSVLASVVQHPAWTVTNLNSPFVAPGGIGVYSPAWGRTAGYSVTEGQRRRVREVLVRGGRVRAVHTRLSRDTRIVGRLLVGRGPGAAALGRLRVGDRLTLTRRLDRPVRMAITGNKVLLAGGAVQVVDDTDLHPRTAVGVDRDSGDVLLLVVDGRSDTSRGLTMVELATMIRDLGAEDALNLDGGGSSTLVAARTTGRVRVLNAPSDGFQRHVSDALEVTYTPPPA